MAFMQMMVYRAGATYSADCGKCGCTMYTHEWTTDDHNNRRDAMQDGTARCDECNGKADADTFHDCGQMFAGLYAAPGYMDRTEWHYHTDRNELVRELKDMYGDDEDEEGDEE